MNKLQLAKSIYKEILSRSNLLQNFFEGTISFLTDPKPLPQTSLLPYYVGNRIVGFYYGTIKGKQKSYDTYGYPLLSETQIAAFNQSEDIRMEYYLRTLRRKATK